MKKRYEILENGGWVSVRKGATEERLGETFLRYELRELDGSLTQGLARPGTWRQV